jgi:aspartate ammonia-lyase
MRGDHDDLGDIQVPDDIYYGIQTERARRRPSAP